MTKEMLIEKLEEMGATRWTKYGKDRLYFGGACEAFGLITEAYKSGSISYAEFRGERISNSKGGKMGCSFNKIYLDLASMKLVGEKDEVYDIIKEKIDELENESEDSKEEKAPEGSEEQKRPESKIFKETEEEINEAVDYSSPKTDEEEREKSIKLKVEKSGRESL